MNADSFTIDGFNTQNTGSGVSASFASGNSHIRNCSFTKSYYSAVYIGHVTCDIENCYFGGNQNTGYGGAAVTAASVSDCRILDCVFEGNHSQFYYGAICLGNCPNAEISSCTIRNNSVGPATQSEGGGIYNDSIGVTIKDCTITGNSAGTGGGIYGAATIANCYIANNHADYGGGVFARSRTNPVIANSIIANNTAVHGGGVYGESYSMTNCTVVGNVATGSYRAGGGLFCATGVVGPPYPPLPVPSDLYVTNTIFANNSPNAIGYDSDSFLYPKNNLFNGNPNAVQTYADTYPTGADLNVSLPHLTGSGNIDGDPAFVNAAAGNYHLLPSSAAIDRGTTVPLTTDYDGAPRPVDIPGVGTDHTGEEFDIGTFEYQDPHAPALHLAGDAGGGLLGMIWSDDGPTTPSQYLGCVYDLYEGRYVARGAGGTIWYPFPPAARTALLDVAQTGAYHAWISSQWWDGTWLPCLDPKTLIVYSGTPHASTGLSVEDRGGGVWRLHWKPEIYGTWLDQIAIYQNDIGWIAPLDGPCHAFPQFSPWTFLDYGGLAYDSSKGDFFAGWADFALPPGGSFVFFLNFKAWDAATDGPFAFAATN
ncbi:MAG: right-handed parallel beta-helix repeat-containing protein [Candidatus Sumerlaeota bacterium]|nr:right-handed parallel beta-helix repeat-containing protein [Candidatus Sumerlaeota bacterium]